MTPEEDTEEPAGVVDVTASEAGVLEELETDELTVSDEVVITKVLRKRVLWEAAKEDPLGAVDVAEFDVLVEPRKLNVVACDDSGLKEQSVEFSEAKVQ